MSARVRYMVDDVAAAEEFYTRHLGFTVEREAKPFFAMLARGDLRLVLSTPFGPGGAAKPMLDGRTAEPGGWNRILLDVDDLNAEIGRLRQEGVSFRSDVLEGPGGREIVVDDPSGNPVELFEAARS